MSLASVSGVNIAGAGLAGSLLAILFAKRGFKVTVYERRPDPRIGPVDSGRSINLALAARGIRGLRLAGVFERVMPITIPMRGRMVHEHDGATELQMYGVRPEEVIHSVSRATLNRVLIEEAAALPGVSFHFGQLCLGLAHDRDVLEFRDEATGRIYHCAAQPSIATDGGGSAVRDSLVAREVASVREEPLDHDYKELTIPARDGKHILDPNALHIWPRGGFMLIALPNQDGTFTATVFLARVGPNSFEQLRSPGDVDAFFAREFPSARALIPDLVREWFEHPQGSLGTVYTRGWHLGGSVLLLGDAAHAIVPFHGQGMNCAFEDCAELLRMMDEHHSWAGLFEAFEHERRPNTDAIAKMALENYREMRETVLDPDYRKKKKQAEELERKDPGFIPRYSKVMFHPEIRYLDALGPSSR
ncbi:MAG TPA: NAD(P)/FAD-dependent oxidoreductase [Steroidobacteraceae bacterium]|nr:NAD(P)/FAD-dependent oxidoreductase [Steroidobacteraceae bacterium]